jgi:hypothetical protein
MKLENKYWITPPELYKQLDSEFNFDFDPFPYPTGPDALTIPWGNMNYVNPPFRRRDSCYSTGPAVCIRKAISESRAGKASVIILPVKAYITALLKAGAEVRPIGPVHWIDVNTGSPKYKTENAILYILKGATHD